MNGVSTITQKGQVTIPKSLRDLFRLKASDKLYFEVKNNGILAHRVSSIEDMRGIAKTNKVLTKKEYKKIIRDAVIERFKRKTARERKFTFQ